MHASCSRAYAYNIIDQGTANQGMRHMSEFTNIIIYIYKISAYTYANV